MRTKVVWFVALAIVAVACITYWTKNRRTDSRLTAAIRSCNWDLAEQLVHAGADVHTPDRLGVSPLQLIAEQTNRSGGMHEQQSRQERLLYVMLDHDLNIDHHSKQGELAWQAAAMHGHIKMVDRQIGNGVDINQLCNSISPYGKTALGLAASTGDLELARLLLDHHADPNIKASSGVPPLVDAMNAPRTRLELTILLLERGAKVDARSLDGSTALWWAATREDLPVANLLIAHGADVNTQRKDGSTPLHIAAAYGNAKLVSLLLRSGASNAVRTRDGKTPLDLAVHNLHEQPAAKREYEKTLARLHCAKTLSERILIESSIVPWHFRNYVGVISLLMSAAHKANRRS